MKFLIIPFLAVILITAAFADDCILKNRSVVHGEITGATSDTISITTSGGILQLFKGDVDTIVFTHADLVRLTGENVLQCKIAGKLDSHVLVATPEGTRDIGNDLISDVQYNAGGELRLTQFPETGKQFHNDASGTVWSGSGSSSIFIRARIAAHFAGLGKWKDSFVIVGGDQNPELGPIIGAEVGYGFPTLLRLLGGYEYYTSKDVKLQDIGVTTHVSYTYLYGGARVGGYLSSLPQLFLYGLADVGVLNATQTNKQDGGATGEITGSVPAFRIGAGMEYFLQSNWSLTTDLAYLSGNVTSLSPAAEGYELNCSGVSAFLGISYHFNLH
jgi:opacity protein-like surface antigen